MKKALLIAGIVFGLLLAALIVIPIFFKDEILALIQKEANKRLNAQLVIEDVGLNLFQNFPDFTLNLKKLAIINNPPFEGDTLVSLANFETTLDLMSLVRGAGIKIKSITLTEPRVKLVVLPDSTANWDVAKVSEVPSAEPETTSEKGLNLALQSYAIERGYFAYDDQTSNLAVIVQALDHRGSGDFTQDRFSLRTNTTIGALTFASGGVNFLNGVRTRLKADIDIDNQANKFTLLENELQLNELLLRFDGSIAMAEETMDLDMSFAAPTNEFKNIISLIPAIYQKDFAELKSSGTLALQGQVNGVYRENHIPALDLQLQVNNGMFQYPQLPTAVNNVNLDLAVSNPGGDPDQTVINLKKFHVELGRDPFDASLVVKTPVSDPHLNLSAKGKINLSEIKNLVPLEAGTEIAGGLAIDLRLTGNLSSIEKNEFQKLRAEGNVMASNLVYAAKDLPEKVNIQQARLTATPENFRLSDFACTLGTSDLQASGTLENFLPYFMGDGTLKGTLALQSRSFDLNPWMAGESEALTAVELPDKIDFTMNSTFQKVQYGKLELQNVRGLLVLKDRALHLMDLNMNLLGGALTANGSYSTPPGKPVHSTFDLKIENFGIPQAFESFVTVQTFAPIAQSMKGNFSTSFQLSTDLDSTLMPVWGTMTSRGALKIANAVVEDFLPLTKVAEWLKLDKYKKLVLREVSPSYKIRDGRFILEPLTFKVADTEFLVSGSNGIDQSLEYSLKLRLPAKELNQQTNAAVSQLLKQDVALLQNEYVDVMGFVKGSVKEPQVKFSTADVVKGATAQVTSLLTQQAEAQKAAVTDTVNAELEKQKKELEKLQQAAADSAKREADRLKEEAKKRLKGLFKP